MSNNSNELVEGFILSASFTPGVIVKQKPKGSD